MAQRFVLFLNPPKEMGENNDYLIIGAVLHILCYDAIAGYSASYQTKYIARYCLTDSSPHASNPGTVSRVTTALLSTALQAGL